ncbi:MAG: diaminopimelate decarboxylase [Bacteroidales bacterium]
MTENTFTSASDQQPPEPASSQYSPVINRRTDSRAAGQDLSGYNTPFYLYDMGLLHKTLDHLSTSAARHQYNVHYAMKANHETKVLDAVRQHGFGIDCVSGPEILAALDQGFSPDSIVFAGVGKTDSEIRLGLESGILCFNCESLEELAVIAEIASGMDRVARVALRVNPEVDAETHQKITTGRSENKFGIQLPQLGQALDLCRDHHALHFMGLHFHIGSQVTTTGPFARLCRQVNRIWQDYRIDDYGPVMLNMGGGLGIDYADPDGQAVPDFDRFFAAMARHLVVPKHIGVHFELGRSVVGQCCSLISRVLYVKKGVNKQFLITDAGMTELMRPALYGAEHKIENLSSGGTPQTYDVVGPACESSDVFASNLSLPATCRGDLLAVRSCGAYVQSMTLNYNLRPAAPAVFDYSSLGKTFLPSCKAFLPANGKVSPSSKIVFSSCKTVSPSCSLHEPLAAEIV